MLCFSIVRMLLFRCMVTMIPIACLVLSAPSLATNASDIPSTASLDYRVTETLLSMGIVPRAVIDPNTPYSTLEGAPQAINLGTIIQPNLELLDQVSPELVLTSPEFIHMVPRLSGVATVKSLTPYNSEIEANSWQRMMSFTREVGDAIGSKDLAEIMIQKTESDFQTLRSRIAGEQILPLLVVRLMDHKHARVFGNNSLFQGSLDQLGLLNAWEDSGNYFGVTMVSVDSLVDINARLVILESPYATSPSREQFAVSGMWQHLPMIKRGDFIFLPSTFNHFGSLPSALRFAEALVEALETPTEP
ncbi:MULTISPECIES: ABC transporter substrate-binding protein [unclassified Halomonas]|uniref:ABC transporter substrate-binding protein n=1 Tax=unclassified Halomonas TaxID=2609666 RepID=UPI00099091C1|nr:MULTISPECIES: ABC transporter substrate-binding protein [unclassified Halomonas]AQU81398.1 ABC transporter substrate-binding protein [Halomonas sp. 'Soap Lake \